MPAMLIKRVSSPRVGNRRKKKGVKGEGGGRKRRRGRNRKKMGSKGRCGERSTEKKRQVERDRRVPS